MGDADELLRFITNVTRARFESARDLMRVVIDTAPHDAAAARAPRTAHARLRGGLALTARRLAELNALRDGVDEREATARLWFSLADSACFALADDNGWPLDKTERWLYESLRATLLRPGAAGSRP